jgi:hypothetical protein
MTMWIAGTAVYLGALVVMVWLWGRSECTLRTQYELDERSTDELLRVLASASAIHLSRPPRRVRRRRYARTAA